MLCYYNISLPLSHKNKKNLTKKRVRLLAGEGQGDSQIGQLLYYLVGIQLKSLQLFLNPSTQQEDYDQPMPVLGIFMEEGMV